MTISPTFTIGNAAQGGGVICNQFDYSPIAGGSTIGACIIINLTDSISGSFAPANNSLSVWWYDACGDLVRSVTTNNWYTVGFPGQFENGTLIDDAPFTVPSSGVCFGQWQVTASFTETFTDGQPLTDTRSHTFSVNVPPPGSAAAGLGGGDATVHDPSPCAGDPVNCTSGNFSESYTDIRVPGRGPGLGLTRTYNSLSASASGIFGYGWTSPYEARVTTNVDGSVTVTEADGSQVTAAPSGGGYSVPSWADSTLTRNGDGTWTFVRQQTTTYTFDSSGRLTGITDRNGYATTLSYNGSGQLSTVTDSAGRTLTFTFGSNGLVSQVADPVGQVTHYGYDGSGNLTSVTDPLTRETQFSYDTNHLLLTITDPNQGVTTNVYDGSDRVTQQTDPAGLVTHFAYTGNNYSSSGGTTTITDPHGSATVENYTNGLMTSKTVASGTSAAGTWTYGYDSNTFGLTAVTDPNHHSTSASYDSSGNLLTSEDALNRTTTYTYNSLNEPLTITDPAGVKTTDTYDSSGNLLTKVVTGIGGSPTETTTYSYTDGHPGDVTKVTDPAGHVTDYTYDDQGDLATVTTHPTTGVNDTTAFVYDTLGRKVCEASANATAAAVQCPAAGQPRVPDTTTWVYDADGETLSVTDPDGNATSYLYDGDGNPTRVTNGVGNITKTVYDADSRKTSVTAGYGTSAASTITYAYDIAPGSGTCSSSVAGATYCTTTSDPSGQSTVDYFNARSEQIEEIQPSSGTSTSTYDPAGNLATLTTAGGKATYGYDVADELTSITYSNPASGFAAAGNVTYTYDADGQRKSMVDGTGTTSYTYDSLERLQTSTNGAGSAVGYGYDLDNEITSIAYPGSGHTVTQTWDGAGQESSVSDWLSHTTNFSYDADGNPQGEALPNTTTITSSYDNADNLLTSKQAPNANPNNPLVSLGYTYNADSQIQSEGDTGTPAPTSQSYGYDAVNRITSSSTSSFAYDSSGDPTQLGQTSQSFGSAHQLTSQASPISRVGTTSAGDNGTGSSLTLTLPSGTTANDQILLSVTLPGNQSIKSTPSGYTAVGTYSSGTGASNVELALYRRTAQTGDTNVTITFSKTFAKAATLVVYRGVNPVTPIDVSSNGTTASGSSVTTPSITTTKANDELVLADGAESALAGSWTAPSGMTTRVSQAGGSTTTGSIADQTLGAAGATGSRVATFSVTGSFAAGLIALQPAATTYSYDALGDRTAITNPAGTTTLAYDQLGRMTAYGTTTYAYNGDGVRMSRKVSRTTTPFTWESPGQSDVPLLLVDGSTDYIYSPDGQPLEQLNGTTALYYYHDNLGSTRAITNASGTVVATYTYTSYGTLAASTGTVTNPLGFAGAYTDPESGLVYLQHRYYDPSTGEFTSVDPAVDQTEAPYAYVDGDPVAYVDPYGLGIGIDIGVGAAIGGLVGGFVGGGSYLYGAARGQYAFSWSGLGSATESGAVGGLVTGACVGATWVEWSACGALGGAAATAVSNLIHGNPLTCHLVVGTVAGAIGGALGGYMFPLRGFRPYKYSNIYRPGLNSLRLYGQAYTSAVVGASAGAAP